MAEPRVSVLLLLRTVALGLKIGWYRTNLLSDGGWKMGVVRQRVLFATLPHTMEFALPVVETGAFMKIA